ncbi:structural maintenance of chromosomes flexible hinge domain protein [Wolffia australiana]
MVARMMRWPPWPPVQSKKFQVKVVLLRLESLEEDLGSPGKKKAFMAEVRWKGPKTALASIRKPSIQRNYTVPSELSPGKQGSGDPDSFGFVSVAEWNEEFRCVCCLSSYREKAYHPWEIAFFLLDSSGGGPGRKMSIVGSASVNLSDFVSAAEGQEIQLTVPLRPPAAYSQLSLQISLEAVELRPTQESPAARSIAPAPPSPLPASTPAAEQRMEVSALKAGLRKVKILTDLVSSARWSSKREDSGRSDDSGQSPRALSDDEAETESVRKSFSYGTLAAANVLGGGSAAEDWFYYSGGGQRDSDAAPCPSSASSSSSYSSSYSGRKGSGLIPWKKRKMSFRSPRPRGEPLLKRAYAEDGGDDIDYDRRQLSSSDGESSARLTQAEGGDFGDEEGRFEVGRWEQREVASRDGQMKLQAEVFFASMDQRSEEAGGESACAALVAVIADWLLRAAGDGPAALPIKSQFDGLIREGSRQWRRLCDDPLFRCRFPDRHLDLDAVLQGGVRPLALVPAKSFVGFFRPDCRSAGDEGPGTREGAADSLSFLSGAMSFDSIWDEVSRPGAAGVYIVSWNDHFFVLKAEEDAYYIIDTLGERLHEGCAQAYILKFDAAATISRVCGAAEPPAATETSTEEEEEKEEEAVAAARGKECCKEYIKSFLAAIPVRELQAEVSKGLIAAATPPHHRLQIEFHFAASSPPPPR